jgi:hypothetical protein
MQLNCNSTAGAYDSPIERLLMMLLWQHHNLPSMSFLTPKRLLVRGCLSIPPYSPFLHIFVLYHMYKLFLRISLGTSNMPKTLYSIAGKPMHSSLNQCGTTSSVATPLTLTTFSQTPTPSHMITESQLSLGKRSNSSMTPQPPCKDSQIPWRLGYLSGSTGWCHHFHL